MSKIKNFVLALLIIIAGVQVYILWLEKISDHNFFYKIKQINKDFDDNDCLADNFKMIVRENKNFYLVYKPDSKKKYFYDLMLKNLEAKSFVFEKKVKDDFFGNEIYKAFCIYDYDFLINRNDFFACLDADKKINDFKFDCFDKIFFYDHGSIVFFNSKNKFIYKFASKKKIKDEEWIKELKSDEKKIWFYDANRKKFLCKGNKFNLKIINPYKINNELLMSNIAEKINVLFCNGSVKTSENVNNVFEFFNGDQEIAKYLPDNIIEYVNYKTEEKEVSLCSDYVKAVEFIKKDLCVKNSFILKDYKLNDDYAHEFYFDYFINNLEIGLNKDWGFKNGVKNFICVTVKNNVVLKYKKSVFNFANGDNWIDEIFERYFFKDGFLLRE